MKRHLQNVIWSIYDNNVSLISLWGFERANVMERYNADIEIQYHGHLISEMCFHSTHDTSRQDLSAARQRIYLTDHYVAKMSRTIEVLGNQMHFIDV